MRIPGCICLSLYTTDRLIDQSQKPLLFISSYFRICLFIVYKIYNYLINHWFYITRIIY